MCAVLVLRFRLRGDCVLLVVGFEGEGVSRRRNRGRENALPADLGGLRLKDRLVVCVLALIE